MIINMLVTYPRGVQTHHQTIINMLVTIPGGSKRGRGGYNQQEKPWWFHGGCLPPHTPPPSQRMHAFGFYRAKSSAFPHTAHRVSSDFLSLPPSFSLSRVFSGIPTTTFFFDFLFRRGSSPPKFRPAAGDASPSSAQLLEPYH